MAYPRSELADFYGKAPACKDLERGESVYKQRWTCKRTGQLCGARSCPERPWLSELLVDKKPETKPEISEELALEKAKPIVSEPSPDQDSEKLIRKETVPRVLPDLKQKLGVRSLKRALTPTALTCGTERHRKKMERDRSQSES